MPTCMSTSYAFLVDHPEGAAGDRQVDQAEERGAGLPFTYDALLRVAEQIVAQLTRAVPCLSVWAGWSVLMPSTTALPASMRGNSFAEAASLARATGGAGFGEGEDHDLAAALVAQAHIDAVLVGQREVRRLLPDG